MGHAKNEDVSAVKKKECKNGLRSDRVKKCFNLKTSHPRCAMDNKNQSKSSQTE
jgi:hypothetical protein